ncbi:MAG: tetratricopeptide repeat protein [Paracoccus sp. (in: a-proteobacteria)]|nr:tetratricopeptide repeat protein [Paracoccus sp. (in: a-proteobacteria)]
MTDPVRTAPLDPVRAALAKKRPEQALALLDGALAELQEKPRAQYLRARALTGIGRLDEAMAALDQAEASGVEAASILRLRRRIDAARIPRPDLRALLDEARLHLDAWRAPEAEDCARRALQIRPDHPTALRLLWRAILMSEQPGRLLSMLQEALETGGASPGFPDAGRQLRDFPRAQIASLLAALSARWPAHFSDWETTFAAPRGRKDDLKLPDPASFLRPVIVDDRAEIIASSPGAGPGKGRTVLVVPGLADRVMLDYPAFDAYLAAEGMGAVYLRDFSRRLFLCGVGTLGADFDTTIAALRARLAAMGTQHLVVLGSSAGGFAAVTYGLALGARRIVVCSGPTGITPELLAEMGDGRGKIVARRIQAALPPEKLDLRPMLRANPTDTLMFFGAGSVIDRRHAARLDGLPGVRLLPQEGVDGHDIMGHLLRSGALIDALSP